MIIHWTYPPERTNLEIQHMKGLYWPMHKHEMQVEQYAVVGMTSLVRITNLWQQGVYTNEDDDEGAEQKWNDDGRE
eukprot:gene10976-22935_t